MNVCDCNAGIENLGKPGCIPIQNVTSSLILVPLKSSTGVKNGIDLSTFLPDWNDLIISLDPSTRWFPLPQFEDVTIPKADPITAEAASGRKAKLRDGKRSFAGDLWEEDSSPTLLGKMESAGCVSFGVYIVDIEGNLIGSYDANDNFLYPIPVDNSSWDVRLMLPTDSEPSKIHLEFDFSRLFKDSTLKMLTSTEAGVNFNELEGLIDVIFTDELASASTQEISFKAMFEYGTALNPIKYQGATNVGDWTVNVNGLTVSYPTLVAEVSPGSYVLTMLAGTFNAGDLLEVIVMKSGFSGNEVNILANI